MCKDSLSFSIVCCRQLGLCYDLAKSTEISVHACVGSHSEYFFIHCGWEHTALVPVH